MSCKPRDDNAILKILLGPVAQRLEQTTHNRLVVGSIPSRPTTFLSPLSREFKGIAGFLVTSHSWLPQIKRLFIPAFFRPECEKNSGKTDSQVRTTARMRQPENPRGKTGFLGKNIVRPRECAFAKSGETARRLSEAMRRARRVRATQKKRRKFRRSLLRKLFASFIESPRKGLRKNNRERSRTAQGPAPRKVPHRAKSHSMQNPAPCKIPRRAIPARAAT